MYGLYNPRRACLFRGCRTLTFMRLRSQRTSVKFSVGNGDGPGFFVCLLCYTFVWVFNESSVRFYFSNVYWIVLCAVFMYVRIYPYVVYDSKCNGLFITATSCVLQVRMPEFTVC